MKNSANWHDEWSIPRDSLSFGQKGAVWYPINNNGEKIPIKDTAMEFDRNGVDYVAVVEPSQRYVIGSNAKRDWAVATLTDDSLRVESTSGADFRTTKEALDDLGVIERIDRLLTYVGIDRIDIKMYQVGRGRREDLV